MTDAPRTAAGDEAAGALDGESVPDYVARFRLDGRRHVVLGGGQGMGRQTSHALAQLGAEVAVVDVDEEVAKNVAAEIGGGAAAHVADITDARQMERLAAEVGDVDGVVDIVGMARYTRLTETSEEDWAWEHDMVLRHAWLAVRAFGPRLARRGGGSMAFVASVSGMTGAPMHGAYGVFKAGLLALVRTAALELGPSRVRVNAVCPGTVWTPRVAAGIDRRGRDRVISATPLRRIMLPSDIASALVFLLGDMAAGVNGHALVVDGGATVKFPFDTDGLDQE